ncbi:MAG: NAD(P)-dependent oxidoreductase [Candidatus Desantisbacteria bacterium]
MKIALMIGNNAWLQQIMIREFQCFCDEAIEVIDISVPLTKRIEADVLICWKASEELIKNAKGLKLIQVWGAGIDQIDMKAAQERNIIVCNTKGAMANAMAEYVLMQILVWERDLLYWNKLAHAGDWDWGERNSNPFVELNERSLGIIGMGMIGTKVASMAANLGLRVYAITKNPSKVEKKLKKQLYSLGGLEKMEEVVASVDYLSLHLPLTEETRHLVNAKWLQQMKPNSVLINTSRGAIIDEAALAMVLKDRRIRGASLDVLENEPISSDNPLKEIENLILTCHQAGYTTRTIKNTLEIIKKNIGHICPI